MKKILITATVLFLTACSSAPNIVGTNKPILNMAANLAPALDVDLSDNTAALKNKTTQQLNVLYHLYWYNTQGVTQVWAESARKPIRQYFIATTRKESV